MAPERRSTPSLDQLINGYGLYQQAAGYSISTRETARRALAGLARTLPAACREDAAAISPTHMIDWAAGMMDAEYAAATRDQRIAKVKAFFNWAVKEGFLPANPADGLKRPRNNWQPTPFTPEQIKRLVSAANETQQPERDSAIVSLLTDTGIRASEICAAPLNALNLSSGQLVVVGKGGSKRVVIFGKKTKSALWRWLMVRPECDAANLFVSRNGRAIARTILGRHIRHIGEKAGVSPCYPHLFRHTFAVMYLRAGGDPYSLQYLLGHSDMTVTRMYVRLAAVDVGELYKSPLDRI